MSRDRRTWDSRFCVSAPSDPAASGHRFESSVLCAASDCARKYSSDSGLRFSCPLRVEPLCPPEKLPELWWEKIGTRSYFSTATKPRVTRTRRSRSRQHDEFAL